MDNLHGWKRGVLVGFFFFFFAKERINSQVDAGVTRPALIVNPRRWLQLTGWYLSLFLLLFSSLYLWSLLTFNEEEKANLLCLSAVLQRQKKHQVGSDKKGEVFRLDTTQSSA